MLDDEKVVALEQRTAKALEDLAEKFAADIRRIRDDSLRESIDSMSTAISGRLASIESRLGAVEQKMAEAD